MMHLEVVMIVRVLICRCGLKVVILVHRRHNVNMVVRGVGMRRAGHVVEFPVSVQLGQDRLRVLLLDGLDVRDIPKVQLMNDMADIQRCDLLVDHQPCEDVLIRVTADVEVARDLLDCKRPCQPTPVAFLERLFRHLILLPLIRLAQQLEVSTIQSLSSRI